MSKINKVKIGIIGHGFVGRATDWGFNKNTDKFIVDPKYGTSIEDLSNFKPSLVFVCVPTPMADDGSQDASIFLDVIKKISEQSLESVIVVKSTVLPDMLIEAKKIIGDIVYNPEFLREKHALLDFQNSDMIILGGKKNISKKVANCYENHSRCKTSNYIFLDLISASIVKYAINTFLATKVIFFNELKNYFSEFNSDESWTKVIDAIKSDPRIGDSHMDTPGHDGKKGFGGACFPKDTSALARSAMLAKQNLTVLEAAIKTNNKIRKVYKDIDSREKDQNISFDDKI
tara:strand:+ start:363 stop:1226 length:864 start_codon:yes stop_codon:yes gene_type:complete